MSDEEGTHSQPESQARRTAEAGEAAAELPQTLRTPEVQGVVAEASRAQRTAEAQGAVAEPPQAVLVLSTGTFRPVLFFSSSIVLLLAILWFFPRPEDETRVWKVNLV